MPSRKAKKPVTYLALAGRPDESVGLTRHFQARGILAQRVHVRVFLDAAGLESQAKASLQRRAAHGLSGRGRTVASPSTFGREQKGGMAMGFPLLAQQVQGALGQRHVTVAIAFAAPDVDEHALGVDVAHLQAQAFA